MNRKWTVRLGILVLFIIFGIYLKIHQKSTGYIKRYKLLNIADSTEITGIKMIRDTDTVMLARRGNNWVVNLKGRVLPANNDRINQLAGKMLQATYQIAGYNMKNKADYGINDTSSTRLFITTKDGKTKTLIIGKRGPVYSSFYFVFPKTKKVYTLFGLAPYEISTNTDNYRNKKIVDLKLKDIKSFTLINDKDTFSVKVSGDTFISNPVKDTSVIKATINRARVLTAFGFADNKPSNETGLKDSNKRVVFITQQDDTIEITVGKKDKYALYVASNKRPGEVFKIYRSWFDEVLKKAGLLPKGDKK